MSDPSTNLGPVGELAASYLARYRRGERPSLEEYVRQYPELAEQIRDLFPALMMVEELGPVGGPPEAAPPEHRPVPRQLGDYRILREVGRGGMGVVYEAVQESLRRHVALKVFPAHGLLAPTHLERFRREAQAAARLHHSNIVPVFAVGESDGVHFYAMQFIQGKGLDEVLKDLKRLHRPAPSTPSATRAGCADPTIAGELLSGRWLPNETKSPLEDSSPAPEPTSPAADPHLRPDLSGQSRADYFRTVARMGLQVAEALAHAHQEGVLHRDIKPSNLLLDARGTVWVTDFGLAKAEGTEDLSHTGDIVGTLRYMAPERFHGWSDPRSDVYGLGITLYELATLHPAFQDSSRPRLIERILHEDPPRPRKQDLHIPRDLETIILKAMAKEPSNRYPTGEALAEDLRRFLSSRSILARRAGSAERTWRWCRRNPLVASLAGALGLILVGSVAALTGLYWNADAQRRRAEGAEESWQEAATEARAGEAKARQAEADTRTVLDFFQERVLRAAGPKGLFGGLGREATIRAAVDQAEPGISQAFAAQPQVEASVRETLGMTYSLLGEPAKALQQHERALALRQEYLPSDDPATLSSMGGLAMDYYDLGRYTEALRLHEETLRLRRARLGPDHVQTVISMTNLANTLESLGRLAESLPIRKEALRLSEAARGIDHRETLVNMRLLGHAYVEAGRPAEGIPLLERALKVGQARYGANHFETIDAKRLLAKPLWDAGRLAEATVFLEDTLKWRSAELGPSHPETLDTMSYLASIYRDAGRFSEAVPLFEEVLRLEKTKNGPDDVDTLIAAGDLAGSYRDIGRLAEAEQLFKTALSKLKTKFGPDHPARIAFMNHAGACLIQMKKFDEAEALLRECLDLRTRKGPGDWRIFHTKSQLGQALTGLRRYAEAETLLREADRELAARKEKLPHWAYHYVTEASQALARLREAQRLSKENH